MINSTVAPRVTVQATKEVILSAGSINTPQILLNSGIGDPHDLGTLGIKSLVLLPSVGKNATDHPLVGSLTWRVNSTETLDFLNSNVTALNEALTLWNQTGEGALGALPGGATHVVWQRLPKNSTAFSIAKDPSSGPNAPHIEIIIQVISMYRSRDTILMRRRVLEGSLQLPEISLGYLSYWCLR